MSPDLHTRFKQSILVLATAAASLLLEGRGPNAWAQAQENGRETLDTMTVMVGGGVRGRIDTLDVRVRGGPSDQQFFRIVLAKGYRVSYALVADSGFQNLSVMVGPRLLPSRGEVVVGDARLMIVSVRIGRYNFAQRTGHSFSSCVHNLLPRIRCWRTSESAAKWIG